MILREVQGYKLKKVKRNFEGSYAFVKDNMQSKTQFNQGTVKKSFVKMTDEEFVEFAKNRDFEHKECPHCGSTEGFRVHYAIEGSAQEIRDFEGNLRDMDRETFDSEDANAQCLNCGRPIDTTKLNLDL